MVAIKSRHTRPEIVVRSLIHRLGFRFRLHSQKLVGKPDIVLPRHRKLILVNGCFWHGHGCKRGSVQPKTNSKYWSEKRHRNMERDRINYRFYEEEGWEILIIWECETKKIEGLVSTISKFLGADATGRDV